MCIRNTFVSCVPVKLIRFAQEKITAIHGRNVTCDGINERVDCKGDVADSVNVVGGTVLCNPTQIVGGGVWLGWQFQLYHELS